MTRLAPRSRKDAAQPGKPWERIFQRVLQHTGADLSDWQLEAVAPRLAAACDIEGAATPEGLLERPDDAALWTRVAVQLTRRPTTWFADAAFYRLLRVRIAPWLRTYPSVRVWVPGEAGGEETASLAIVLDEERLLERARIYATAPVEAALQPLRSGRFAAAGVRVGLAEHALAGGHLGLDRYFDWEGKDAILRERLRRQLVVGQHSLATDGSLNEFHVIVCRRAILDFNARLRARALRLFWESLPPLGVLVLPPSDPPPSKFDYQPIDPAAGIYRRRS